MLTTETDLIDRALAEDVGDGDATTEATVAADARGRRHDHAEGARGDLRARRRRGRVPAARPGRASIERLGPEGVWREGGPVLRVEGSARALLTAERTALNFLGRLSGVATKTARVVRAVGPGRREDPRHAQDHARACGCSRRPPSRTAAASTTASGCSTSSSSRRTTRRWRAAWGRRCGGRARRGRSCRSPSRSATAAEIDEALAAGAQRLLLDNMTPGRGARRGRPGGRPRGARSVRRRG